MTKWDCLCFRYSSEYDDTTKVISLKSSTKLAPSEQSVNLYPVYRKDIQILNTKDNGEKVTIYDNYTTLSKLNFRKGNYTLHVLDGAGKNKWGVYIANGCATESDYSARYFEEKLTIYRNKVYKLFWAGSCSEDSLKSESSD